ncbi:response regulator [Candidatus Riflebacteria bacterium]
MKIFLLEDSEMSIRICKRFLKSMGMDDITTVKDGGLEGMKLVLESLKKKVVFEIFFVDINMPGIDGIKFVETLRKVPHYKETAIIMITSDSDQQKVLKAIKAGANNFILKPFTMETFSTKVQETLKKVYPQKAQ